MGPYTELLNRIAKGPSHQSVVDMYVNRPVDDIAERLPVERAKELARDYYDHVKERKMVGWNHGVPVAWDREGVYFGKDKNSQLNKDRREFLSSIDSGATAPVSYEETLRRYSRGLLKRQQRVLNYSMAKFRNPYGYASKDFILSDDIPALPLERPSGYLDLSGPSFTDKVLNGLADVADRLTDAAGPRTPNVSDNANTAFWNSGAGKAVGKGLDYIYGKRPPEVK